MNPNILSQNTILFPCNLKEFLTNFLRKNYGEETLEKHVEAIKSLNNLRNVALCTPNEFPEKRLELVYEYYLALKTIEPLLTLSKNPKFAKTTWYDLFPKSRKRLIEITDNRFSFEIVNVLNFLVFLHNEILMGENTENNKNDNWLTENYELMAGYLTEMKRYSQKDGLSSERISIAVNYASLFTNVYLCNAQIGIILNIECNAQNCRELLDTWNFILSKDMDSLDIIKKSKVRWLDITFKGYFDLISHLSFTKIFQIQSYIDMIEGRYCSGMTNIKTALNHAKKCSTVSNDSKFQFLYYEIKGFYLEYRINNKMFDPPEASSLLISPTGDTIKLVKPVIHNIEIILNSKKYLSMKNMISLSQIVVRKATKIFLANISPIVKQLSNSIEKNNIIFDSILFEKYMSDNVSPSIVDRREELSSKVKIESVTKNLISIENLCTTNKQNLNKAWETLKREENSDANYQKKYFEAWPRSFSPIKTKLCRETLKTYEEYLIKSEKADNVLKKQLATLKSFCLSIANSNDFSSKIMCKNNLIENSTLQLFCDVKGIYKKINNLKEKQTNLLKQYTKTENEIDSYFTREFYKDCTMSLKAHIDALVYTLKPVKEELEESIENQDSLAKTLLSLKTKINNSECSKTYFGLVYTNYNLYKSIQKRIDEGFNFYNILCGNVDNIQSRIDAFCLSRDAEAREIIKRIEAPLVIKETNFLYSDDLPNSNTYFLCHKN